MLKSRTFNQVIILNGNTIRKSGTDRQKIVGEYTWMTSDTPFLHPKAFNLDIRDDATSYDMQYIHGRTLSEFYTEENLPVSKYEQLFGAISDTLSDARDIRRDDEPEEGERVNDDMVTAALGLYEDKTCARLAQAGIDLDTEYVLNGQRLPSLRKIIDDCKIDATDIDISVIHGDMCFSNIILEDTYNYNTDGWTNIKDYLYYIDPRGVLPDGRLSIWGDRLYDIAKLAHSVVGMYDMIMCDKLRAYRIWENEFAMNTKLSPYKSKVVGCFEDIFTRNAWIDRNIHLFLSMIPLHSESVDHQQTMLANALRLYLQKT